MINLFFKQLLHLFPTILFARASAPVFNVIFLRVPAQQSFTAVLESATSSSCYTMLRLSYYFIFKQCQDLCVFCLYTMTRPVCYLFVYNVKTCVLSVFLYNVKTCVCVLSVFYTMSRHVWYLFLYNVKTGVISIFMKCQDLCANVLSIL